MAYYNTTLQNHNTELQLLITGINNLSKLSKAKLQDKNITENGVYTADSEYDALGNVTVDIEGGDKHTVEDGILTGELTTYINNRVETIWDYAFYKHSTITSVDFSNCTKIRDCAFFQCNSLETANFPKCTDLWAEVFWNCIQLTSINFPNCSSIGFEAFYYCPRLATISFPNCTNIGGNAFNKCAALTSVSFPNCTSIGTSAFYSCTSLTSANFPNCSHIKSGAFSNCSSLTTLILTASSVVTLDNITAFANTPMSKSTYTGSFGSIYVPVSLVDAYKSATNWATYANRIAACNDSEEDKLIFYIEGVPYECDEGATWEEWVESSDYDDSLGLYFNDWEEVSLGELFLCDLNGNEVYRTDTIKNLEEYTWRALE